MKLKIQNVWLGARKIANQSRWIRSLCGLDVSGQVGKAHNIFHLWRAVDEIPEKRRDLGRKNQGDN